MKIADVKNSYRLSEVVSRYCELRVSGREHWGVCPFHNEKSGSLCVQDDRRFWNCYGCGKRGDVVDFVQMYHKCSINEAVKIITGSDAAPIKPRDLPPIVDHYANLKSIETNEIDLPVINRWLKVWNPKPTPEHPKGRFAKYRPLLVHPYRTRDGKLVGCTIRVEMNGKKIVPMLRMIRKDQVRMWSHFSFQNPRTIYGCETIRAGDATPILIVEGEKCADIARRVLGGTAISWAGGANAAKFTDWSPLRGRNVLLWPDADEEGLGTMEGKFDAQNKWINGIKDFANEVGAAKVRSLGWDKTKPKGWDIGDAVQNDRMTRADILTWMKERLSLDGAVG